VVVLLLAAGSGAAQDYAPAAPTSAAAPAAPPQPAETLTFFQIMFSGGPLGILVMLGLVALSIAALALAIDGVWSLRRSAVNQPQLADEVRGLVAAGELAQAAARCDSQPGLLASVLAAGLAEGGGVWSDVQKALEDSLARETARLHRPVEYLGAIANVAPLVGLLGTLAGMLVAFKQSAGSAAGFGSAQLAGGLYQALIPLVVSLLIAIPSLAALVLLRSRIDQVVAEAAGAALSALAPLRHRDQGGGLPLPPPLVNEDA